MFDGWLSSQALNFCFVDFAKSLIRPLLKSAVINLENANASHLGLEAGCLRRFNEDAFLSPLNEDELNPQTEMKVERKGCY